MSSAAKAIRYLLRQNPGLTGVVPVDRIVAGRLKEGTQLPAVFISHISTTRRAIVKGAATQFCTSRIQVTVYAKLYPEKGAVLELVRKALPPTRGDANGVDLDSIQPGGDGPDLRDDQADIYIGTSDFIVTFNE